VEGSYRNAITRIRTRTSVSGVVRRNQVPRLQVGTRWGYISHRHPRTARATGSRNTSNIGEIVGPRLPRSVTYGCVQHRARHRDLTTRPFRDGFVDDEWPCGISQRELCKFLATKCRGGSPTPIE
jgi:hypothetical protein